jgi:3'5'-cyclic nucleotide phosphodiesterase
VLFGALMHDIDHTGRNNMFEINRQGKLSIRYNDNSVLENHHTARTFSILADRKYNIFENMHQNNFPNFRKYVIHSILSTDIKKHFTELA